jgi:hypothetical protein
MFVAFGFCLGSPAMGCALKKISRTKASGSVSLAKLNGALLMPATRGEREGDSREDLGLLCERGGALGEYA